MDASYVVPESSYTGMGDNFLQNAEIFWIRALKPTLQLSSFHDIAEMLRITKQ